MFATTIIQETPRQFFLVTIILRTLSVGRRYHMDPEWIELMNQAREQGISKEQIRSFIGGDNMQHPVIDQIETTGYPLSPQRESVGTDGLGNDVFPGDPILMLNDEFFLIELLESDAIEVLEYLGASYEIAK